MWKPVFIGGPQLGDALFACPWSEVTVDGVSSAPLNALQTGRAWAWSGELLRLDAPDGPLRLEGPVGHTALHRVVARRAARLSRFPGDTEPGVTPARPAADESSEEPQTETADQALRTVQLRDAFVFHSVAREVAAAPETETIPGLLRDALVVTNGVDTWPVSVIPGTDARPGLAIFDGAVPPRGPGLWIVSSKVGAPKRQTPSGVQGFAASTLIETDDGPVPIEKLKHGQWLITDQGPRRLWTMRRRRRARAVVIPPGFFGDGGPDKPLMTGFQTLIGLEGPALGDLFSLPEALLRAGDLEMQPGIQVARRIEIFTIRLETTALIMAGGLPVLCGHPQYSELRLLTCGEAQITLSGPPGRLVPRMAFRGAA